MALMGTFILLSFLFGAATAILGFYIGTRIENLPPEVKERKVFEFLKKNKPPEDFPEYTGDARNKRPEEPEVGQ